MSQQSRRQQSAARHPAQSPLRRDLDAAADARPRPFAAVEPLEGRLLLSLTTLDPTFGTNGSVPLPFQPVCIADGAGDQTVAVSATTAGRHGRKSFSIARYTTLGTLDLSESLRSEDKVDGVSFTFKPECVAVQADGKIIVAGNTHSDLPSDASNIGRVEIRRLNADGTYDRTFGQKGIAIASGIPLPTADPAAVIVQPDGKIVVSLRAFIAMNVVRFNQDGSLDSGFRGNGTTTVAMDLDGGSQKLALLPDGRIYVAMTTLHIDRLPGAPAGAAFYVVRLLPDGSFDDTFGSVIDEIGHRGKVYTHLEGNDQLSAPMIASGDMTLNSDGTIALAGRYTNPHTGVSYHAAARYLPDGSLDSTFGTLGVINFADTTTARTSSQPVRPFANNITLLALAFDGKLLETHNTVLQRLLGFKDSAGTQDSPPTAALAKLTPVAAGSRSYAFAVTYTGAVALDAATFGNRNVVVNGPHGYSYFASVVSVANGPGTAGRKGLVKVVTYSIPAPFGKKGKWDAADNGRYAIDLLPNQVKDTTGTAAVAVRLGKFSVGITAAATALPAPAATVTPSVPPSPFQRRTVIADWLAVPPAVW